MLKYRKNKLIYQLVADSHYSLRASNVFEREFQEGQFLDNMLSLSLSRTSYGQSGWR